MNKGKLIGGIIWLIVGVLLVVWLLSGIQRLLISGTEIIDQMGEMIVAEGEEEPAETPGPTIDPEMLMIGDAFDAQPVETMEPEELFSIPVDETAEELAKENEKK